MRSLSLIFLLLLAACSQNPPPCQGGNCQNGVGKQVLPNGSVFEGVFVSGRAVYGIHVRDADTVYTGEVSGAFVPAVFGTLKMSEEKGTYRGEFVSGRMQGFGRQEYTEGGGQRQYYVGFWKNGLREGPGFYFFPDGRVYIGMFKGGDFSGHAYSERSKAIAPLEYRCAGQHEAGKLQGPGICAYEDGRTVAGEFKQGLLVEGAISYANSLDSDIYVGALKDGVPHGQGSYYFSDGRRYTGTFEDAQMTGVGEMIFPMPEAPYWKYVGQFIGGAFHGRGKLEWKNGTIQDGEFVEGAFKAQ